MTISPTSSSRPTAPTPPPDDPIAAARQFESVLVRQFVEVMTKDLFKAQDEGMMTGQSDLQRDTLTDTLTDHLVDAGTFGIADLLTAQWERQGRVPSDLEEPASRTELTVPGSSSRATEPGMTPEVSGTPRRAISMDGALRLYQPAKAPAQSIDHIPESP